MQLSVDPRIFESFPSLAVGVVIAEGIDNQARDETAIERLREQMEAVRAAWSTETLREEPRLVVWRNAYRSFGAKPKKHRCSVENLIRMLISEQDIPSINPIVDLYNAASLEHVIPMGGDDLDRVDGDIQLTLAQGTERFIPLNGRESVHPKIGEVIYRDDREVLCRRWNWRECDKTKMTEQSTNLCLVVEGLPPFSSEAVQRIADDLADRIRRHCGGRLNTSLIHIENPAVHIR